MNDIAIIILNHNSYKFTKTLVNSIFAYEKKIKFRIYIVDNSLNTFEIAKLKKIKNVFLIVLDENKGYAHGNNEGLKKAISDGYNYFLIANSDTEILYFDTIYNLFNSLKMSNAYVVGPKLIDDNHIASMNPSKVKSDGKIIFSKHDTISTCDSIIGAFYIFNKTIIDRFGFLNERYFMYFEETDYFYKISNKNYTIIYNPEVSVIHHGSAKMSYFADFYFNRNRFLFIYENSGDIIIILIVVVKYMMRICKNLIKFLFTIDKKFLFKVKLIFLEIFYGITKQFGRNIKVEDMIYDFELRSKISV